MSEKRVFRAENGAGPAPRSVALLVPISPRHEASLGRAGTVVGHAVRPLDWLVGFAVERDELTMATLGAWRGSLCSDRLAVRLTTWPDTSVPEIALAWGALARWARQVGESPVIALPWGEAVARPLRLAGWHCDTSELQGGEPFGLDADGLATWRLDSTPMGAITLRSSHC